jgi:hypothetical protein
MGSVNPIGEKDQVWHFKVDENGCFESDNCYGDVQISTTTKEEEYQPTTTTLYPNPAKGEIRIDLSNSQTIKSAIISNAMGLNLDAEITDSVVDISNLSSGIYTLSIVLEGNEVINLQFVKVD